jgi:hypothetical protein
LPRYLCQSLTDESALRVLSLIACNGLPELTLADGVHVLEQFCLDLFLIIVDLSPNLISIFFLQIIDEVTDDLESHPLQAELFQSLLINLLQLTITEWTCIDNRRLS